MNLPGVMVLRHQPPRSNAAGIKVFYSVLVCFIVFEGSNDPDLSPDEAKWAQTERSKPQQNVWFGEFRRLLTLGLVTWTRTKLEREARGKQNTGSLQWSEKRVNEKVWRF